MDGIHGAENRERQGANIRTAEEPNGMGLQPVSSTSCRQANDRQPKNQNPPSREQLRGNDQASNVVERTGRAERWPGRQVVCERPRTSLEGVRTGWLHEVNW